MATYSIPPIGPGWQLSALVARYRFSATIEREVIGILEDAYRAIAERIRTGPALTRTNRLPIEQRFLEIRALLAEAYGTAQRNVTPLLREYAALERDVAARQLLAMQAVQRASLAGALVTTPGQLAASVGAVQGGVSVVTEGLPRSLVVSAARLTEIVQSIDIGGIGWGEWWTRARDDGILRVRRTIQLGVVQGQNPTTIGARIWASGATVGPNAWKQSRTVAMTASRTVVAALQTDAQLAAEAQFANVIGSYRFEATLDLRTSAICRPLDGTVWRRGDPRMPTPPLHPNCRSTLVPIVDVPGVPPDPRPRRSYEMWLREQPPNVQNAILGRGIAEHFRHHKTPLADLLSVDRRPMTLTQLRTALYRSQPESYVGWIAELPRAAQDAVLGPVLAKKLSRGLASIDELLHASALAGVVRSTP